MLTKQTIFSLYQLDEYPHMNINMNLFNIISHVTGLLFNNHHTITKCNYFHNICYYIIPFIVFRKGKEKKFPSSQINTFVYT